MIIFNRFYTIREEANPDNPDLGGGAEVTTIIDEAGKLGTDWYTKIEGIGTNTELASYATIQDLARDAMNLQQGVNSAREGYIKGLGENATPEEITAFRSNFGVPTEAKGYELNVGEDSLILQAEVDDFANVMHAQGVPKDAAQALLKLQTEKMDASVAEHNAQAQATAKATEDQLKTDWGADFVRNKELAESQLTNMGVEADQLGLYLTNPVVAKMAQELASHNSEGTIPGKQVTAGAGTAAIDAYNAANTDPNHPLQKELQSGDVSRIIKASTAIAELALKAKAYQ